MIREVLLKRNEPLTKENVCKETGVSKKTTLKHIREEVEDCKVLRVYGHFNERSTCYLILPEWDVVRKHKHHKKSELVNESIIVNGKTITGSTVLSSMF